MNTYLCSTTIQVEVKMSRIAFRKTTPEGLSIDVEEVDGVPLLLLTKTAKGVRAAQIMGTAGQEVNTSTVTWYIEWEPLPKTAPLTRYVKVLVGRGYLIGKFDQYGNFRGQ